VDRTASSISMLREDRFSIATTNSASGVTFLSSVDRKLQFPDYTHDGDKNSVIFNSFIHSFFLPLFENKQK